MLCPAVIPLLILVLFYIPLSFTVKFHEGIYEDVVIGVSPRLSEESLENITINLKTLFTDGSSLLCGATDGAAMFGAITVVVPSDWKIPATLNLSKIKPKGENFENADIQLEDVFDFNVQRAAGCGQRGVNIQLPASEILSLTTSTAKSFVSAWSQFRYGVYPEDSPGNYYDPELNKFLPNSCTNEPLNFTYGNSACDNETSDDCEININFAANDNINSSLLYRTDLKNVKYFCDESTHNKLASTLQNRLCDGKSVKEVVMRNEDFASSVPRSNCSVPPVKISYVQYNGQRIFIGLALKEDDNFDDIVRNFQSSLFLTLSTTATEGSIVTLLNDDQVLFNETVGGNRVALVASISEILENDTLKPSSGISNLLNAVKREVRNSSENFDYSFLLITNVPNVPVRTTKPPETTTQVTTTDNLEDIDDGSGLELREKRSVLEEESFWEYAEGREVADEDISAEFIRVRKQRLPSLSSNNPKWNETEAEDEVNVFKELGIRVYGVSVGNTTDYTLDMLTSSTGGKSYSVESLDDDETAGFLAPMIALGHNEKETKALALQQKLGNDRTNYSISYVAHAPDVALLIRHAKVNQLKNITIHSGTILAELNCSSIPAFNSTSCTVDAVPAYMYYSTPAENWTVEIETEIPSPVSLTVIDRSKRQTDGLEAVPGKNMTGPDIDFREKSLFLYVYVTFGRAPVRNAEAKLIISSENENKYEYAIFDDGKDPDIRKWDGFYSGLWDRCVKPGRYNIKFIVTTTPDSCAAKKKNNQVICEPIPSSAKRIVEDGSVLVKACRKHLTGDFVKNLKVVFKDGTSNAIFTWTDTWDTDTVANLTLRYLPYPTLTRNVTEWTSSSLLQIVAIRPKDSKRIYTLDLSGITENLFTVALLAEDEAGKSEVSIPVNVSIPVWSSSSSTATTGVDAINNETTTIATEIKTTEVNAINNETTTIATEIKTTSVVPNSSHIKDYPGVIISVALFAVFIVAGLVILFVLYKWRTNRNDVAVSELLY